MASKDSSKKYSEEILIKLIVIILNLIIANNTNIYKQFPSYIVIFKQK